ncbi:M16 family metallopeptidase [Streptomyces sp. NPDC085927]|uniref:M16 family metallopeptidase n=1 Tax=Streptomyces sp. NPDC085927 TaxID=3365738 RepID=UPI0037D4CFC6
MIQDFTLPNGLRALLVPDQQTPRVAVAVHYGVGFRSEQPGQEGLAHLFEHLMFCGSENFPGGSYFREVLESGGWANATTHQDYTEYFQVVTADRLESALFAEADRMRAPTLNAESLAAQLNFVEQEIATARADATACASWPLLGQAMFDDFANAHDGYGELTALRNTSLVTCRRFALDHYVPANAVLTVTGRFDSDHVTRLVKGYFGDIPSSPPMCPAGPLETASGPSREIEVRGAAGSASVVAVGFRLPGPELGLTEYVAHMVVAQILADTGVPSDADAPLPVTARCGFFQPMDALSPDVLQVVARLPEKFDPALLPVSLGDRLKRIAAAPNSALSKRAAGALVIDFYRRSHEPLARARSLGRNALLFGDPRPSLSLPDLILRSDPASAAARLLEQRPSVVVVRS